jgi:hypothetical protein
VTISTADADRDAMQQTFEIVQSIRSQLQDQFG